MSKVVQQLVDWGHTLRDRMPVRRCETKQDQATVLTQRRPAGSRPTRNQHPHDECALRTVALGIV
jgi:hypothetical protein